MTGGQVEGGFVQGLGWCCLEELVWGDAAHPWVPPGTLHTRGPGAAPAPPSPNGGAPTGCSDIDVKVLTSVHVTVAWLYSLGRCSGSGWAFSLWCLLCISHNRESVTAAVKTPCRAGTYKIPTVNDIPLDLRVTLLRDAPCARTPLVHSSKAVGEPPLFLGASVFFALKAWPLIGCRRVNAGIVRRTTSFLLYCQQHQFSSCDAIHTSVCVLEAFRTHVSELAQ